MCTAAAALTANVVCVVVCVCVCVLVGVQAVEAFGIDPANTFAFWDWVGGRYSVTSAVGVLPLALQYGMAHVQRFLQGAWAMDSHFRTAPLGSNMPVLMGLLSVWNTSFLSHPARALLPYSHALAKFPAHIQQVNRLLCSAVCSCFLLLRLVVIWQT